MLNRHSFIDWWWSGDWNRLDSYLNLNFYKTLASKCYGQCKISGQLHTLFTSNPFVAFPRIGTRKRKCHYNRNAWTTTILIAIFVHQYPHKRSLPRWKRLFSHLTNWKRVHLFLFLVCVTQVHWTNSCTPPTAAAGGSIAPTLVWRRKNTERADDRK